MLMFLWSEDILQLHQGIADDQTVSEEIDESIEYGYVPTYILEYAE